MTATVQAWRWFTFNIRNVFDTKDKIDNADATTLCGKVKVDEVKVTDVQDKGEVKFEVQSNSDDSHNETSTDGPLGLYSGLVGRKTNARGLAQEVEEQEENIHASNPLTILGLTEIPIIPTILEIEVYGSVHKSPLYSEQSSTRWQDIYPGAKATATATATATSCVFGGISNTYPHAMRDMDGVYVRKLVP